jgi:hypothetical protein
MTSGTGRKVNRKPVSGSTCNLQELSAKYNRNKFYFMETLADRNKKSAPAESPGRKPTLFNQLILPLNHPRFPKP